MWNAHKIKRTNDLLGTRLVTQFLTVYFILYFYFENKYTFKRKSNVHGKVQINVLNVNCEDASYPM